MIKIILQFSVFAIGLLLISCKGSPSTVTSKSIGVSQEDVTKLFKSLEGKWKGKKYVYSDPRGQADEQPMPHDIDIKTIITRPTKTEKVINITKEFTTHSETEQRIKITEKDGKKSIHTHQGTQIFKGGIFSSRINKTSSVESLVGQLIPNAMIWECHENAPQKVEFFKQTIIDDMIRTIGWGYYEGDDLTKAPPIWYLMDLKKVDSSSDKEGK